MSIINANPLLAAAGGDYQISRSVRLRSSASAYFNRTPASASNRKTWTWSGWVKRGSITADMRLFEGYVDTSNWTTILFDSSDRIQIAHRVAGTSTYNLITTAVYRDPSAWYHIVVAFDTTQATSSDRVKLYVNGTQVTVFTTNTIGSQNVDTFVDATNVHNIGRYGAASQYFDGYMTEINFIDGQQLTSSSFGTTNAFTGAWIPMPYTGTYGANGFYLNFSDNSAATATTIGKDYSGNGNNWTPNNISVTSGVTYDSMIDVPTLYADGGNGRGNYCTLNPLDSGASFTPSDGNLRIVLGSSLARTTRATMGVSSGKWYFETVVGGSGAMVGVATASAALSNYTGSDANGWSYYGQDGNKYTGGVNTAYGSTYTTNDVIGVALDMDSGKVWFSKNGTWQASGDPAAGTNAAYTTLTGVVFPVLSYANTGGTSYFNAGQRPFSYTPPTGFVALNTQNLPDATIKKGNQYFDVVTRTGTGTADGQSQVISSLAFTPDLVWNKARSNAFNHNLVDSARGNDAILFSNLTNAETSVGTTGTQLQITANGFTAIQRVSYQATNQNGVTYADWCWKEGASAGFDIVTYTGTGANRTVAHSLGVTPSMMIVKSRSSGADGWPVFHSSVGNGSALVLNSTSAINTNSVWWNNTSPSSSVFTVGTNTGVNGNAATYVAYLFAEVAGYSKFGKYTGNGSADGPFLYCGFRPRFVMMKRTDSTGNWFIDDSSRVGYNVIQSDLLAEASNAEGNYNGGVDFLSNGFKLKATANGNASGGTFIFMAFAENPFRNSLAR